MNKRQIILDFTSLLDVIMIILFFFILFSSLEKDEALATEQEKINAQQVEIDAQRIELDAEKAEYEALKKEAEKKSSEADKALADYQEALSNLENLGESAAQNVAEMHKFDQSMNLKIHMKMDSKGIENNNSKLWQLDVFSGNDKKGKIGEIKINTDSADKDIDSMVQDLSELLNKAGYTEEKTILCEFFYNGYEKNSSNAYPIAEDLFKRIRFSYRNFKVSETDTSIFTQANTIKEDFTNEKK